MIHHIVKKTKDFMILNCKKQKKPSSALDQTGSKGMYLILFTFNSNLQARTRKRNSLSLSELRGLEEQKGKSFENNG